MNRHLENIIIALQVIFLVTKLINSPYALPWVWVVSPMWIPMALIIISYIYTQLKHKFNGFKKRR